MPLDANKIAEILAKKNAPKPRKVGTGRKKVNVNDRSYEAWFALEHRLYDRETGDPVLCDNDDCLNPRDKSHGQSVVFIEDRNICRYCFLSGWLLKNPAQQVLEQAS